MLTTLFALTASASPPALAQTGEGASTPRSVASRFALTAAYYGETLTHPGATVGFEYYAVDRRHYKLIASSKFGTYLHRRNHTAAFLDAELGHRWTAGFGLFGDVFTGVGYFHSRPWGDIYATTDDGEVDTRFHAGRPRVKPSLGLGVGWDLSKNTELPLSAFTRLELFGEYPFNTGLAAHAAVMGGIIWRFGQGGE